jgi:polyphosphate kinase 2
MKRKEYEREMRRLHGELVALQEWVKSSGAKDCIVFGGRDTAGKGGTINRITERVSPRVFRVVALPAPTAREQSQMYIQRYIRHFLAAGEVVIFDRSWDNRAGVERVMGFCTPEQTERFLEQVPAVEKAMVESGILLLKYWLEVGPDEQTRRLESRIDDPRKIWKLTDMDLKSYSRWYNYSRARCDVRRHGQWMGSVVHRAHRRQEARPAERHQPPAEPDPVRAARASRHHAAQAARSRRLCRTRRAVASHPDAVLSSFTHRRRLTPSRDDGTAPARRAMSPRRSWRR